MEEETPIQVQEAYSSSCPPVEKPPEMHAGSHITAAIGCIIPNRIFVGRIDHRVNLRDLRLLFSQHGTVREVKIVTDRAGMSKGYGFVTFESHEDVVRILHRGRGFCLRGKRLSIGQAIQRHQHPAHLGTSFLALPEPGMAQQAPWGSLLPPTDAGFPTYTYPNLQHWPMLSQQPLYHQPAHHPFQCQWDAGQLLMPPGAVAYPPPPPEFVFPPADGVPFQHPAPLADDVSTEVRVDTQYAELSAPPPYDARTPHATQHDLGKGLHPSPQQPRSRHFLAEPAESPDAFYFSLTPEAPHPLAHTRSLPPNPTPPLPVPRGCRQVSAYL